ncbi:hypothetical protein F8M41_026043 [Gigaspora margarita]|uniref:Uncharacterized protein n=1 Tax=Gigaspora margarita TaxID=4874 RepID=A0A8H3XI76_GIGMA|nr:hypothetical protein F8M41_026043 [Gigaspora margarita]
MNFLYFQISIESPNREERQAAVRRYLRNFEALSEEEEIMLEIFENLINNEQSSFARHRIIEETHIIQTRFDSILIGMKPDFTVRTTNPNKHVELLIGEVKPPNTRDALVNEDLVCLGKMLKCSLDKAIEDGVDDPVICGLQVIGFLGRAYTIDLRFDRIYRMILIGEFELPRCFTSWGTVLQCYQVLNKIRTIVNDAAIQYQSSVKMNIKQKESKQKEMIKPMFLDPMKISILGDITNLAK